MASTSTSHDLDFVKVEMETFTAVADRGPSSSHESLAPENLRELHPPEEDFADLKRRANDASLKLQGPMSEEDDTVVLNDRLEGTTNPVDAEVPGCSASMENSEHRISIPEDGPYCCRICTEEDTPDNLIELSCNCQGDLSRAHRVCILKWFGVRMWLKRNYTCELCSAPMDSIKQMVILGMADHEGRKILFEAIGAAMVSETHEEAGPNVGEDEENAAPGGQPGRGSAWSRFRNSNRPYTCLNYTGVIIVAVWMFWIGRWFYIHAIKSN